MTWWGFSRWRGVLELDEPALELHWLRLGARSIAWWSDAEGRWLGAVPVGEA
jgi:hypothetical protein